MLCSLTSFREMWIDSSESQFSLSQSMPNTQNEVSDFPCVSVYGLRIVSYLISLFEDA